MGIQTVQNFTTSNTPVLFSRLLQLHECSSNVRVFTTDVIVAATYQLTQVLLCRRRKGVFGPAMGKQCVLFVDDLSMPVKEVYGAQPPIELLRQWIDHGHWYDLKDTTRLDLVDIVSTPFFIVYARGIFMTREHKCF